MTYHIQCNSFKQVTIMAELFAEHYSGSKPQYLASVATVKVGDDIFRFHANDVKKKFKTTSCKGFFNKYFKTTRK